MTKLEQINLNIKQMFEEVKHHEYIHGSKTYYLENIAFSIGICTKQLFSDQIKDFFDHAKEIFFSDNLLFKTDFYQMLIANCMVFAGKNALIDVSYYYPYLYERINRLYNFVLSKAEIFYSDEERLKIRGIPKPWAKSKVVRVENINPYPLVPQVYDLLSFHVLYGQNKEIDEKINQIVEYLFTEKYQNDVINGYGIGINKVSGITKSKFFAVGWDIGVIDASPEREMTIMLLLRKITSFKNTKWYKENISKYLTYKNDQGKIIFPRKYIKNKKSYWICGSLDFDLGNNINAISSYLQKCLLGE